MKPTQARVVVSGSTWMGGGLGSVESSLLRMLQQATDEVLFVIYSISSGPEALFEQMTILLQRGVRVRMIINRFAGQHPAVQGQLRQLRRQHPRLLTLLSFVPPQEQADLHAKVVVVDRQQALVGSANLSLRGLINNHELGMVVEGTIVTEIARAIDTLMTSRYTVAIE